MNTTSAFLSIIECLVYLLFKLTFWKIYSVSVFRWNLLNWAQVEVEVTLQLTFSRPVSLGVRSPSGTCDQFFFIFDIFFRHFQVYYFVAPSLMKGRVCNLLLLLIELVFISGHSTRYLRELRQTLKTFHFICLFIPSVNTLI
jgi:hypothetical protein